MGQLTFTLQELVSLAGAFFGALLAGVVLVWVAGVVVVAVHKAARLAR